MKALYYRYLFENVENGMIQAGSIYNEENDCSVNYVYLSGNPTNSNINDGVSSKDSSRTNDTPLPLDLQQASVSWTKEPSEDWPVHR